MQWSDLSQRVLEKLDIESEYRRLGVEITGKKPNDSGWIQCRAIGRIDREPSAAINVGQGPLRGRYRDLGGSGDSMGLWDFASKYGTYADWREARRHYTSEAGYAKSIPKGEDQVPGEVLDFPPQPYSDMHFKLMTKGLCAKYPGVTPEALRMCGARIARYPKKSQNPVYVVALPCYGPNLIDGGPTGYVYMRCDGELIMKFNGDGHPPTPLKRMTHGSSGLVGLHAIENLSTAEVIFKVEGISDLLTLQSQIPPEHQKTHLVITNAGGASESHLPFEVAPVFSDKWVAIVHDADKAGQDGAGLWISALAPVADRVTNVELPYAIREKKGLDLRDWFAGKEDVPEEN